MHHSTLRAAINKYKPLADEGKSETEVKAAIAADEKGFIESDVNEIYTAIVDKGEVSAYSVIQQFRDKDNFNTIYSVGDDVSDFDAARLENLVTLGVVRKNDE